MVCPPLQQQDCPPAFSESEPPQISHILPLYHMYTSVVSKSIHPEIENNTTKPPTYDDASLCLSNVSDTPRPSLIYSSTYSSTTTNQSDLDQIVADEATTDWQDTILQNIHKLKSYDLKHIQIEMKFTKDIGEVGVQPQFIDILNHEYKQGDSINGYIYVKNLGSELIYFDMFYVVFEGYFKVKPSSNMGTQHIHVKKFLEMFDFSASWHYGTIYRNNADEIGFSCDPTFTDPLDNMKVSFFDRKIAALTSYKRLFSFKIPDRLLDSSCDHSISSHTEIPPTLGPVTPLRFEEATPRKLSSIREGVKDLLFTDSSISYNVSARFIGKSVIPNSERQQIKGPLVDSEGVEYVILKDCSTVVRILAESKKPSLQERKVSNELSLLGFKNFLGRLDEYLEIGSALLNENLNRLEAVNSPGLQTLSSSNSGYLQNEVTKIKQAYKPSSDRKSKFAVNRELENYHVFLPLQKKLFGAAKNLGTVNIATPKVVHTIKYVPPQMYTDGEQIKIKDPDWNLEVPLDIEFACLLDFKANPSMKPPVIKSVAAELTVFTLRTNGECIPFDISYDMIIDENRSIMKAHKVATEYDPDQFENNIFKPVQDRIDKIKQYSQQLGPKNFTIEEELVKGMKCIQRAVYRRMRLPIADLKVYPGEGSTNDCNIEQVPWKKKDIPVGEMQLPPVFRKSIRVGLDLSSAHYKGMDNIGKKAHKIFCLIPTFQLCKMVRMYYVTLALTLHKGEVITIQVPVEVEK